MNFVFYYLLLSAILITCLCFTQFCIVNYATKICMYREYFLTFRFCQTYFILIQISVTALFSHISPVFSNTHHLKITSQLFYWSANNNAVVAIYNCAKLHRIFFSLNECTTHELDIYFDIMQIQHVYASSNPGEMKKKKIYANIHTSTQNVHIYN